MEQRLETIETLPFAELQAHPERITDMLASHDCVPILLERRGNTVSVGAVPRYSRATDQLLEEALAEYADMKRQGYDRDAGFRELEALRQELSRRAGE